MATTTVPIFSMEELQQDVNGVGEAAVNGPVFITRPGQPALVLLTQDEYAKLKGPLPSLADLLSMPEGDDIEFEPPRLTGSWHRDVDLSD